MVTGDLRTLTPEQLPVHAHPFYGSTLGSTQANPQNAFLAAPLAPGLAPYGTASPRVALAPEAISESGGSGAHANVQPFVALTFIISWATIPYVGNQSLIVDDPLIGEVRLFSRAAPNGWLTCDGQILQISANEKLHAVIGNRFGGDGVDTFALPNLQGATAIGVGQGPGLTARTLGERGGSTHVALTDESLPRHSHAMLASAAPGSQASPSGQSPARSTNLGMYAQPVTTVALAGGSVGAAGGGLGHDNMQPYLGLLFCIAVEGDGP